VFLMRSVCIDFKDCDRTWKGGRYGLSHIVLLANQDLLLVLSEKGEVARVNSMPKEFLEIARFPTLKGKTWIHPVLVNDILLFCKSQEMAAFRLALGG
jgi:outer membrane protein assembly factor BamB